MSNEVIDHPTSIAKIEVVLVKKQLMVRSSSDIGYGLVREPAAFFCRGLLPGILHALVYSLVGGDNGVSWVYKIGALMRFDGLTA